MFSLQRSYYSASERLLRTPEGFVGLVSANTATNILESPTSVVLVVMKR